MPEGENSTVAGEVGSTVSRNLVSEMSSMRAPFSRMLPAMRGVSILTRFDEVMASSRLRIGPLAFDGLIGAAPGAVPPGCGVVLPGLVPGCAVGLASCSGSRSAPSAVPSAEYCRNIARRSGSGRTGRRR